MKITRLDGTEMYLKEIKEKQTKTLTKIIATSMGCLGAIGTGCCFLLVRLTIEYIEEVTITTKEAAILGGCISIFVMMMIYLAHMTGLMIDMTIYTGNVDYKEIEKEKVK